MQNMPSTKIICLLLITLCIMQIAKPIVFTVKRGNIFIDYNSNYTFRLAITQTKSQINPLKVQLYHSINNSLATTNQYFDYFKYLSKEDILCYNYSIGNSSYLFPCPFLLNNNSVLKVPSVNDSIKNENEEIKGLNQIHEHFIVDNTPYPFPKGSYPYSSIAITSSTILLVQFNDQYRNSGMRLVFINGTLILVYLFIIAVLVYKTRKILQQMKMAAPDFSMKKRLSEMSRDNKDITEQDEQSDIDNYEQIVANQFSIHQSKASKQPSLLSSSVQSKDARLMKKIEGKN